MPNNEVFDDVEEFDNEMVDDIVPEMFDMVIEAQKTAVSLTSLVLEHTPKTNLTEQAIYDIYQRSFQQVINAFENGLPQ